MTDRQSFTVTATSTAEPATLYRLLADGSTWPSWTPISRFELERPGDAGGEGVGAIRAFMSGPVRSREQLLELRANELIRYTVLSGPPLRHHEAQVELAPVDGGTRITWSESFEPKVPGTGRFLRWFLTRFVQQCADGLVTAAATRSGAAGD